MTKDRAPQGMALPERNGLYFDPIGHAPVRRGRGSTLAKLATWGAGGALLVDVLTGGHVMKALFTSPEPTITHQPNPIVSDGTMLTTAQGQVAIAVDSCVPSAALYPNPDGTVSSKDFICEVRLANGQTAEVSSNAHISPYMFGALGAGKQLKEVKVQDEKGQYINYVLENSDGSDPQVIGQFLAGAERVDKNGKVIGYGIIALLPQYIHAWQAIQNGESGTNPQVPLTVTIDAVRNHGIGTRLTQDPNTLRLPDGSGMPTAGITGN